MASDFIIGCESVIIFYFRLVKILRDQTINKNILKFYAFTKVYFSVSIEKNR